MGLRLLLLLFTYFSHQAQGSLQTYILLSECFKLACNSAVSPIELHGFSALIGRERNFVEDQLKILVMINEGLELQVVIIENRGQTIESTLC